MAEWTTSAVLIAPAAQRDAVNALAQAMGWGPDCYAVPLSATGEAPATHYGLHSWVSDGFAGQVEAAAQGELPAQIAGTFDPAQVAALVGTLIVSIRSGETDPVPHFAGVIASASLGRIDTP